MGSRLVLPILLALQGCAAYQGYPGPERPESEIAILEGYWHYYVVSARIAKFDKIDGMPIQATSGDVTRLTLAPGRHSIEVRFGSTIGQVGVSVSCTLEADFEKGHRYRIASFNLGASRTHIPLELQTTVGDSVTSRQILCPRNDG